MAKRQARKTQPRTAKSKAADNAYQKVRRRQHPAKALIRAGRYRAKKKGIEFSVEVDDLLPLPETCPLLGLSLHVAEGKADSGSYSLDKIDPDGPYDVANTRIISWRANRLRSNGSNFEHMRLALADATDFIATDDECRELILHFFSMRRR